MGPVIIRIANDLAAISVLQAGAAVFVRNAGFGEEVAWQTGLVLEEILSNIFQYELPADQEGSVESTLSTREGMLEVRLHFRGIPFDVDRIKAWEKTDISEIVEKGGRGFGLRVHQWGDNLLPGIKSALRGFCLDRLETIYLYLPLFETATAAFCRLLEEWGFFFCGIKPGQAGRDWLVLQYLNNQRYDYGRIQTATGFGDEFVAYVQACDPDAGGAVG